MPEPRDEAVNKVEQGLDFAPQFEKRGGLLPVIVQSDQTLEILMLGWTDPEALKRTLESGRAVFFSTSRNRLWTKGETSGDFLEITEIRIDCDQDALVYRVRPLGDGVCHTKDRDGRSRRSCFYRRVTPAAGTGSNETPPASLEFLRGDE